MKILQVASSMADDWGGIERYVVYACEGLTARGHEVVAAAAPASPLARRLKGRKVEIRLRRKGDVQALLKYLRLFGQEKFDLVVTHFSPDYLVPARAARWRGQAGLVMTRHVAVPFRPARVRAYQNLYTGFVAVSGAVGKVLERQGLPALVAWSGCPRLDPGVSDHVHGEAFEIGVFGRLVREKGQEVALRAAALAGEDFKWRLFGRGPDEQRLKHLAQELQLGRRVVFEGYIENVGEAMGRMGAVVVPSTWEEAFGFTALEAMSMGKPVVASRIGGLPEVVEGRGLLVEPGSEQDLAAAVKRLAADRELRQNLAQQSREAHQRLFTIEAMATRLEEAYRQILDSAAQSPIPTQ